MFEWISENPRFKWIYRVHSSSYIHPGRFLDFVSRLPQNSEVVAGPKQVDSGGNRFLSGAGILWSRAAALSCLTNYDILQRHLPEDVGLGLLFEKLEFDQHHIERIDIPSPVETLDLARGSSSFHFRCKANERPYGDIETMQLLESVFEMEKQNRHTNLASKKHPPRHTPTIGWKKPEYLP